MEEEREGEETMKFLPHTFVLLLLQVLQVFGMARSLDRYHSRSECESTSRGPLHILHEEDVALYEDGYNIGEEMNEEAVPPCTSYGLGWELVADWIAATTTVAILFVAILFIATCASYLWHCTRLCRWLLLFREAVA